MDAVNTAVHLDRLARALKTLGWQVQERYDDHPVRLRVLDPALPCFGDSVRVDHGPDAEPWFFSSNGSALAPIWDIPCAVERVTGLIALYRPTAIGLGVGASLYGTAIQPEGKATDRPARLVACWMAVLRRLRGKPKRSVSSR